MTRSLGAQKWTPLGILAVVLGFIVWWPLGLAAIAYILWSDDLRREWQTQPHRRPRTNRASGSDAFDACRRDTLNRMDDEQRDFAAYVERLRKAREREEFDRFMNERDIRRN